MHGNIKWDNEKLIAIMTMRMNGETLQQIADKYGCTRENIRQIIGRGNRIMRGEGRGNMSIIYPNIREYMRENSVSMSDLANGSGICYGNLNNVLKGRHNISLRNAFKVARFLGMTVDEAFATDEPTQNPETVPEYECIEGA